MPKGEKFILDVEIHTGLLRAPEGDIRPVGNNDLAMPIPPIDA